MKKIILFILVLFPVFAFCQEDERVFNMPSNNGKVEISEVVEVEGLDANQLFGNALTFVALTYNSPSTVTLMSDRETGKIIVKNYFVYDAWHINSVLHIDVKDGRYRYSFKDFTYQVVIDGLEGDLAPPVRVFDTSFPSENYKYEVGSRFGQATIDKIDFLANKLKETMAESNSF